MNITVCQVISLRSEKEKQKLSLIFLFIYMKKTYEFMLVKHERLKEKKNIIKILQNIIINILSLLLDFE